MAPRDGGESKRTDWSPKEGSLRMVQLILRRDVAELGRAGDLVNVKPGYARNYLLPQGVAYEATEANLRLWEDERKLAEERSRRTLETATNLGGRLEGQSVSFSVRAGDEGRLFGSVTAADISAALADQGLEVDRHRIELTEPIKELGVYKVPVRLHSEVKAEITVWVVAADE